MKLASQRIVDENFMLLLRFWPSTIFKDNVVIPSSSYLHVATSGRWCIVQQWVSRENVFHSYPFFFLSFFNFLQCAINQNNQSSLTLITKILFVKQKCHTFLACSAALSFFIFCNSASRAAVSSSSLSEAESSSSRGSSASKLAAGTWSSFCFLALCAAGSFVASIALRFANLSFSRCPSLSRSSNSLRKSRLRSSSIVPCPCSLWNIYVSDSILNFFFFKNN